MSLLKGSMTAVVTPFKNGKLDFDVYAKLVKRQIDNNIDAIIPVGTTGESPTLTHKEHQECMEIAIEVCKNRAKVIAGTGSNSTKEAIELAKFAQDRGADAILSITPYYNRPTQDGLYQHYSKIAKNISIPIVLYNVPSRTGVDLMPDTVVRLHKKYRHICAIKEATSSLSRVSELKYKIPTLNIISGDDMVNFHIMAAGGTGAISVTSNLLPDLVSELIHLCLKKDFEKASKLDNHLYPINNALFMESNPIPLKAVMYLSGIIDRLEYRLPLLAPSKKTLKRLEKVLQKYKINKN